MAACRTASTKFPDGEIVGQSVSLGHVLREQRNFDVPPDNWQTVKLAIVGGGVAGLSAAWSLSKNNFNDYLLLELEKEIGGTSRSGTGTPVGYPWGAHYLPVPFQENGELISLLDEMSLVEGRSPSGDLIIGEQYLCREPEERMFYKGRWYEGLYLHAGEGEEDKRQFAEFQNRSTHG
jgi:glycine/D-amino acid oxidase-like deaminating enzyme